MGEADNTMNRLFTRSTSKVARDTSQQGETRLHGKRLILARAACIVAGLLSIGVFIASVPATYEALLTLYCTGPSCKHLTPASVQFVQQLHALGLSVQGYAIYFNIINIVFVCTYFVVAIILFWRRSDDWMALFASFFLMTFAITFSSDTLVATPYWLFQFVIFLGAVSIVVFFYLFPTGRFVPRWTRWLSIGAILYWGFKYFWPSLPFNPYTNIIFTNIAFITFVGAMIVAQIYRYIRVSIHRCASHCAINRTPSGSYFWPHAVPVSRSLQQTATYLMISLARRVLRPTRSVSRLIYNARASD